MDAEDNAKIIQTVSLQVMFEPRDEKNNNTIFAYALLFSLPR